MAAAPFRKVSCWQDCRHSGPPSVLQSSVTCRSLFHHSRRVRSTVTTTAAFFLSAVYFCTGCQAGCSLGHCLRTAGPGLQLNVKPHCNSCYVQEAQFVTRSAATDIMRHVNTDPQSAAGMVVTICGGCELCVNQHQGVGRMVPHLQHMC